MKMKKTCNKCGKTKSILKFYKNSGTKDGRFGACGECRKAWQRDYQKRNNDIIVQTHRDYRKDKLGAGIYTITNTATDKVYIGQTTMLKRRLSRHRWILKRLKHENDALQKDYRKYGEDVFVYEVAEELPPDTPKRTLRVKEALLIAHCLSEGKKIYNLGSTDDEI